MIEINNQDTIVTTFSSASIVNPGAKKYFLGLHLVH